jgi:hypothetical protein
MSLTLYQHIAQIWFSSCGIKDVHIQEKNLGVWVSALDFVVFRLQTGVPFDLFDPLNITRWCRFSQFGLLMRVCCCERVCPV